MQEINHMSNLINNVNIITLVYFPLSNAHQDFIANTQSIVDTKLYAKHPSLRDFWSIDLKRQSDDAPDSLVINLESDPDIERESHQLSYTVSPFNKVVNVKLANALIQDNKVESYIADILIDKIFTDEIYKFERMKSGKWNDNIVFPYSPKYNLVFSLFVEDGRPVNWDSQTIAELFNPLLKNLQHFANFTISTQIQYYAKPNVAASFDETSNAYVVKESDLSNFINHGDWNLNGNDINPTINFIVYYPKCNYDSVPMVIENSSSNSFIVSQFGGLHILNKKLDVVNDDNEVHITDVELIEILEVFSGQLLRLLGVSSNQKNLSLRVDSLTKSSIVSNLHQSIDTLKSLIKLTKELHDISVPELTKDYVQQSLNAINGSLNYIPHDTKLAMLESSIALKNSMAAFFDKDIVQQAYFPSEHKLAVFLPLLGPLCSILLFSTLRLIKEYRK